MPTKQKLTYESSVDRINGPEDILILLDDVRTSILQINPNFKGDLKNIVKIVGTGIYEVNGEISKELDLSSARGLIEYFREHSEGGCQSCISLGRQTIDAQDASSGFYCQISDPDYDGKKGVKYAGFSPKVSRHYKNPCEVHNPFFSTTLDKLLA